MVGVIYKITCLVNNKIYVGKRLTKYLKNFEDYYGSGTIIKKAVAKYGKANFKKEILCECYSFIELNEKERYYINIYNSIRPNGYNIAIGGNGGDTLIGFTANEKNVVIEKRKSSRNNTINSNKEYYIDLFRNMAIERIKENDNFGFKEGHIPHNKNKKASIDLKKKLSNSHQDYIMPESQKKNISKSMKNKNGRKIECIQTGEIFLSINDLKERRRINLKYATINYRIINYIEIEGYLYKKI